MEFKIGDYVTVKPPVGSIFEMSVSDIVCKEGIPLLYGHYYNSDKKKLKVYGIHPQYCRKNANENNTIVPSIDKPIASDGKSSSYYDLKLSQKTIDFIKENGYVKTEHLIYDVFENEFDFANAFKSLIRAWGTVKGQGKAGNSLEYELNKIEYSVNKIREYRGRK